METPIGYLPKKGEIDTDGLDVTDQTMQELLSVNVDQWKIEMDSVGEYLHSYGERLPEDLKNEYEELVAKLKIAS